MGMHFGLIAAKASVDELRAAFLRTWPAYEIVASENGFSSQDAVRSWMKSQEEFVSAADWTKANPGKMTFAFYRDGGWAIFLDSSYLRASDDEKLSALSTELGTVTSFVVETAGGSAFFWCFERGHLRRMISNLDGYVAMEGEPLAEEAGVDIDRYYMAETEALMKAFGLSPFDQIPRPDECQAICVVDHTDYDSLQKFSGLDALKSGEENLIKAPQSQPPKRPWWRFW